MFIGSEWSDYKRKDVQDLGFWLMSLGPLGYGNGLLSTHHHRHVREFFIFSTMVLNGG